jgi:deoxyribonuclease-4
MRLGAHMSISGGKYKAIERGKNIGCESIQIFTGNVRSWASKPLNKQEITLFQKSRKASKIHPIMSHNSYLVNLGNTDKEKLTKSYDNMLDELKKADQLGLEYVNMHPGNKMEGEKDEIALLRISKQLNKLLDDTKSSDVIILLETTAGQGNDIGYKFEHIKNIIDNIKDKTRIGVTFDTQHSFTAGYNFKTKELYENMWIEFDEIIGLKFLYAFHLNDSKSALGDHVDRHEHIGKGKIGKEAFGFLVNDERFEKLPGILETPNGMKKFKENLKVLKDLRKI